jgi:hypothetical protein
MAPLDVMQIVIAGLAPSLIGYAWYSPKLFGRAWMRFEGVTPEMTERALTLRHSFALVGIGAGIATAFVAKLFLVALDIRMLVDGISFALLAWIGFTMPALLGQLLWEHKSFALLFINASFWLASQIVMAVILVL